MAEEKVFDMWGVASDEIYLVTSPSEHAPSDDAPVGLLLSRAHVPTSNCNVSMAPLSVHSESLELAEPGLHLQSRAPARRERLRRGRDQITLLEVMPPQFDHR